MVGSWNSKNSSRTNRTTRQDLPTAVSPNSTSLKWQVLFCAIETFDFFSSHLSQRKWEELFLRRYFSTRILSNDLYQERSRKILIIHLISVWKNSTRESVWPWSAAWWGKRPSISNPGSSSRIHAGLLDLHFLERWAVIRFWHTRASSENSWENCTFDLHWTKYDPPQQQLPALDNQLCQVLAILNHLLYWQTNR